VKRWPVAPVIMTSPFGWRTHPITKKRTFHKGIDLDGETGQPIYAVDDGQVAQLWRDTGQRYPAACAKGSKNMNGNGVLLRHMDGTFTGYAHLHRIDVKLGQVVKGGEQIGTMGSTGCSTGSHLHLSMHRGIGNRIDPVPELPASTAMVLPETIIRPRGFRWDLLIAGLSLGIAVLAAFGGNDP
jgi:murein DD-endopeptidase MepM/ murein hydrolase activator NlpD